MKTKNQFIILAAFIGFVIAYHIFGYIGHYGYDDLHYAKLANDFKNGIIDYNDHFSFRTPLIILTSLSYSIFGVSDFASSLPSILIFVLILFIVFNLLKEKGNTTLIIGLGLTTLSNWLIFYSDKLMPDIYITLAVICTLYVIHQYRFSNKNTNIILFSLLVDIALLLGFMSKGTIILILPLLIYFFIIDIIQKRNIRFWIYTIVGGLVIFLMYFLIIGVLTGDFFKRFEAIANNSYLNHCSYDRQPIGILFKRIAYGFFELIINHGMATGFIFILAYLLGKKSFRIFKMDDSFSFWTTSSILLLLSSNFMSISLTSYSPMCLDPRHYLFLIPIVSIPASIIIKDFIDTKALKVPIIALTALLTIISILWGGNNVWLFYFPLLLLFLVYIFVQNNRLYQYLFVALFIAALLIKPFTLVNYAQKIKYVKQKEIFTEYILKANDSSIVITNDVQKRLGNYYDNFKNNSKNTLVHYKEFKYDSTDTRKKILFLNWYTRNLSGMDNHDLPYYAKNISPSNKLLYQNKELNIAIYEIKDFSIPELTYKLLLHSINDFESKMDNWNQNSENITQETKYDGNNSMQVIEYSPTFEYYLDSLDLKNINQLFISCSAYCNYQDKTSSKLIISVENKEGAYIWNGVEINKYIKAYSNWWPIKHEVSLKKSDIKENSKIKVYLWNEDKQKAYIDNFQVKIMGNNK